MGKKPPAEWAITSTTIIPETAQKCPTSDRHNGASHATEKHHCSQKQRSRIGISANNLNKGIITVFARRAEELPNGCSEFAGQALQRC
jgi:hypothetical protein